MKWKSRAKYYITYWMHTLTSSTNLLYFRRMFFIWMWTGSKAETFCTSHCPLVNYEKYFYHLNDVPTKRRQVHLWILCVSTFSTVHSVNWISMGDGINEVPFVCEGMNLHRSPFLAGYSFYLSFWIFLLPFLAGYNFQYCYSSIKLDWK